MLWPAPSRPKAMRVGACDCWRARWWSSASSRPPAIQRSSGCSKKRAPAAPPQILGHPAQGQRRVRSGDGGRAVGLHRPRDPDRPVVCLDEPPSNSSPKRTRRWRCSQGFRPASITNTRERRANLFMMFAPLEGWRHVKVTDRRTAVDYAHVLKDLARDVHFAQAETIVLIRIISTPTPPHRSTKLFPPPGQATRRALRMALHAETRFLAGLGQIRTRRPRLAMPRPAHPRQTGNHQRGRRLGPPAKQNPRPR